MFFCLAVTVAALSSFAASAYARPYDCPNTTSKKRRDYVCEMNGRLAPDFWNSWGEIKKDASLPFSRYIQRQTNCSKGCAEDLTDCKSDCADSCAGKSGKCVPSCEYRCNRKENSCNRRCSSNDFASGFRKESASLVPLVNSLGSECDRSNNGAACEKSEAKPFCDALVPKLLAYKQAIAQSPRNLRTVADSVKDAFLAIRDALSKRHKALSDEINTKKFKCPKKFITNPAAANKQAACIDAQYHFASSAAQSAAVISSPPRAFAATRPRIGRELADADPDPGLVGCNTGYCWEPEKCDGGPQLVQNFWPTQILNYFGVAIGEADDWNVGDVVSIEDEDFPIVCISHGAVNGGDTNCGNSRASFDIIVVDGAHRPSTTYPTGTCVSNP